MKHIAKRWTSWIVCTVILITTLISPLAAASDTITDEGWTKLVSTQHTLGCSGTQGMAVGDTYLYSVMIGGENTKAIVFRVHKDNGRTRIMKNGDTGENYFTNLGHANDADVAVIDGKEYLFVLASGNDIETGNIVVFEVDGTTLRQTAQYTLHYNGGNFNPVGFAVYTVDDKDITFLFKWSHKTISTGKIAKDKTEGKISVNVKCYLDSTAVEVNGKKRDFTGFANQGIAVYGDIVLATYAGCYEVETVYQSLVLGFDLSQIEKGTPTLKPREDLVFYLESSDYPRCFEIEDCGISSDGKLYFNANCWKSLSDTNHDGVFVLNDFVMPGTETPWENPFTDVKEEDWFYEDVKFVNTKGLMNGTSDTAYGPAEPLTRGQIVTVLWRQAGSPAPKQAAAFTDVKRDWYYTDAIAWAAENKIVEGYGSGIFAPEDSVTREQVMTILYRYADLLTQAKESTADAKEYTFSDWAKPYVSWAKENGILDIGTDITDLTKAANRAEIAACLSRLYENVIEK